MSHQRPEEEPEPLHRLFDPFFFLTQKGLPAKAFDDPWEFYRENALDYPDSDPHPLFETRCYLESWPELAATGANPLIHYLEKGAGKKDSRPNRLFSHRWYMETQSQCPSSVMTPLEHYAAFSNCSDASPNPNRLIDTDYFNFHNHDLVVREQNPVSYLLRFSRGEPRLFSNRLANIANKVLKYCDGPRLDNYRPVRCLILDFREGEDCGESGGEGDLTALLRHLTQSQDASQVEVVATASTLRRSILPPELKPSVVTLESVFGETDPLLCPAEIASFLRGLVSPYKETLVFSSHPEHTPTLDGFPVHPMAEAGDRLRHAFGSAAETARNLREPADGNTDPKVIIPVIDWQISGVNTWVGELSSHLADRGWDVELLSSRIVYRHTQTDQPAPLPIKHLDIPSKKPEWWWSTARDYLVSQAPAVLLTAYDFNFNSLATVAGNGIGMIGVLHSDDPDYYEQVHRLGRSWQHIITVSEHIRDRVGEQFPELLEKTTAIHYGVPRWEGGRPEPPVKGEPIRMIYTGRISHHQKRLLDLPHLLDALEQREVPFHVTMVGDGPDLPELELELAHRIAKGQVEFTGRLTHGEIHARLAASHVFFLISDFEGLPLSLLEAMSHGTVPVVSDMDSGIPEVVHEGETGFRAPIGDYPAFAEILHRLSSDPDLWDKVSRLTQEYFEKELTVDVMVDRTESLIRELSADGPPRQPSEVAGPFEDPEIPLERIGDIWLAPEPPEPKEKKA